MDKSDLLHNYASWGGLEDYWRALTMTNIFKWKLEKNVLEVNTCSHQCIGGEKWYVTYCAPWCGLKAYERRIWQIILGENGKIIRKYFYGRLRPYIYLWSHFVCPVEQFFIQWMVFLWWEDTLLSKALVKPIIDVVKSNYISIQVVVFLNHYICCICQNEFVIMLFDLCPLLIDWLIEFVYLHVTT